MSLGDATIQITGTVMAAPELRYTANSQPVCKIRVLTNPRELDKATGKWKNLDGTSYFVTCFGSLAENVAGSVAERTRVVVNGTIRQRSYEVEGVTKYTWDVTADEIGVSLRFDQAKVQRMDRASTGAAPTGSDDPWATASPTRPTA